MFELPPPSSPMWTFGIPWVTPTCRQPRSWPHHSSRGRWPGHRRWGGESATCGPQVFGGSQNPRCFVEIGNTENSQNYNLKVMDMLENTISINWKSSKNWCFQKFNWLMLRKSCSWRFLNFSPTHYSWPFGCGVQQGALYCKWRCWNIPLCIKQRSCA